MDRRRGRGPDGDELRHGGWARGRAWDTTSACVDAAGVELDPNKPVWSDVQMCVTYAAGEQCTWTVEKHQVLRVGHAFGDNFPTTEVPGGQVALWTGEFSVDATDAMVPAPSGGVSLSRTANTYDGPTSGPSADNGAVTPSGGVFGPGWTSSLDGSGAGMSDAQLVDNTLLDGTLTLVDSWGEVMVFAQQSGLKRRTTVAITTGAWSAVDQETRLSGAALSVSGTGAVTTVTATEAEGTKPTYTVPSTGWRRVRRRPRRSRWRGSMSRGPRSTPRSAATPSVG